nr:putative RNA-directed DNA polymerase, eukaryota, reverse transcriptase zinc-binding domain protein [Tanacetum cinerariifolium]
MKEKDDVLKVDFEKAFDSVSWHFLDYIMEILGFSPQWRRWINAGLVSSRASILVNGSPTSEFSLKRGLRQGDPLSPFLFIMVMEGLNIMLKDGLAANPFRDVKIVSPCFHLLHLFYADDVIIFSEWNQCDMENIIHIPDEVAQMAKGMGSSSSSFPFTYLGLPIEIRIASLKTVMLMVIGLGIGLGIYMEFSDGAVQVFLRFPPRKIWMFGISLREPLETKSFKLSVFLPLLVGCYGA